MPRYFPAWLLLLVVASGCVPADLTKPCDTGVQGIEVPFSGGLPECSAVADQVENLCLKTYSGSENYTSYRQRSWTPHMWRAEFPLAVFWVGGSADGGSTACATTVDEAIAIASTSVEGVWEEPVLVNAAIESGDWYSLHFALAYPGDAGYPLQPTLDDSVLRVADCSTISSFLNPRSWQDIDGAESNVFTFARDMDPSEVLALVWDLEAHRDIPEGFEVRGGYLDTWTEEPVLVAAGAAAGGNGDIVARTCAFGDRDSSLIIDYGGTEYDEPKRVEQHTYTYNASRRALDYERVAFEPAVDEDCWTPEERSEDTGR